MIYLLDYENVRNLTWINDLTNDDRVIIFYTKNANTLTFDEHAILEKTKAEIEYKKVVIGNNALDFQLSSYLGFLIGQDFTDFCIVSKDCGYDSIIDFWKNEKNISIEKQSFSAQGNSTATQKNNKNENKTSSSDQTDKELENALRNSAVELKQNEIKEVIRIFNQYKTKQAINSNLQKHFKDNEKVGAIYKILKPFLKNKK